MGSNTMVAYGLLGAPESQPRKLNFAPESGRKGRGVIMSTTTKDIGMQRFFMLFWLISYFGSNNRITWL